MKLDLRRVAQMWADDRHWYPLFMAGNSFTGLFGFTETTCMVWHELRVVDGDGMPGAEALLPAQDSLQSCPAVD